MTYTLQTYIAVNLCGITNVPQATAWLPPGYTLTGGGAWDLWTGTGNLLTASYPVQAPGAPTNANYTGWCAAGLNAQNSTPAALAVFAIGIQVLNNGAPVTINQSVTQSTGQQAAHPTATALVTANFTGTGGGAIDNYGTGAGNMLTGSYPQISAAGDITGWIATGKDQVQSDPSTITAYAIGIQIPNVDFDIDVNSFTGSSGEFPSASLSVPSGNVLIAGGALDAWPGAGNLLTASYPIIGSGGVATTWQANGKDQGLVDPSGTITVWVVSMELT